MRGEPMTLEEFEKAFRQAKASMELEGFTITEKDRETIRKVCMGEMSHEELINDLKQKKS